MNAGTLLPFAVLVPLAGSMAIAALHRHPNAREAATLITGVSLLALVVGLVRDPDVYSGRVELAEPLPGLSLALQAEPLGLLFAVVASALWIATSVYSVGYMRGNDEPHQTRFYVYFAVSIAATMGIALAANLFTLFVCYEILTLTTYPLVTHKGTVDAKRGGRTYLGLLLSTSIAFLLLALAWTWWAAGTLDFRPGGIMRDRVSPDVLPWLLALYLFGIGKAALMPFHRWLPAAMVAPTPVSALLHAVAVVKAGVFTVVKVVVYVFGVEWLSETGAATGMMWVAAASLLTASLVALTKDNLKARLAYSTVSQLAYVSLGALLATSLGVLGGAFQIVMHATAKITLFFCAGAIYTATHKTAVSEMSGLGRAMPFTFGAFFVASLSIIGMPPFGGSWSKWYLMLGAADAGQWVMLAVLMVSSLLNIAYLIPVAARGFFTAPAPEAAGDAARIREAPVACVLPLCLTAAGCLALFFCADSIYRFLGPVTGLQ